MEEVKIILMFQRGNIGVLGAQYLILLSCQYGQAGIERTNKMLEKLRDGLLPKLTCDEGRVA